MPALSDTFPGALEEPIEVRLGEELAALRRRVTGAASAAGLTEERAADAALVVSELATNVLLHAGGPARVRLHADGGRLVCEVEDRGSGLRRVRTRRRPPDLSSPSGRGLWLVRRLADEFRVASGLRGTTVRVAFRTSLTP